MSQRNPMNDRYLNDTHTGSTRKSAASAKPKAKAASSVIIKTNAKTPEEKKAEEKQRRREERAKQRALDAKYYSPNTPRYKKLRKIWWAMLGGAVLFMIIALLTRAMDPPWITFTCIGLTYVFIILAFWVDLAKVQKERRKFQAEMAAQDEHSERLAKQQARREATASREAARQKALKGEEPAAPEPAAPAKPKRGFFGSGFRLANKEKMKAQASIPEDAIKEGE